ncbi:hypothetical protein P3X46_024060 [Hevea brasiliensis]|uniref:SKP1 component dimerisation domain-containing protein n=1 Tax=Hevea brasiliensis TaxID=3981 RepID=A0ABQ9LGP4_HEVBR|nr:hypothetical protein P3X46_024060 [Hevea brasiliensis]
MESATLKTFLDDNTETSCIKVIPLPNAPEEARKEYDADFVKELNNKQTRELILAVNYLDIKEFAGLGSTYVRQFLEIENDFTPEEEAMLLEENAWAFEGVDQD